jgi:hypothetical protein
MAFASEHMKAAVLGPNEPVGSVTQSPLPDQEFQKTVAVQPTDGRPQEIDQSCEQAPQVPPQAWRQLECNNQD